MFFTQCQHYITGVCVESSALGRPEWVVRVCACPSVSSNQVGMISARYSAPVLLFDMHVEHHHRATAGSAAIVLNDQFS